MAQAQTINTEIWQTYRIDEYGCKRIGLRFKGITKEKFLWHCKDKGHIVYGGFNTYILQPGEHAEHFDGESWQEIESEWPKRWMWENVLEPMRKGVSA